MSLFLESSSPFRKLFEDLRPKSFTFLSPSLFRPLICIISDVIAAPLSTEKQSVTFLPGRIYLPERRSKESKRGKSHNSSCSRRRCYVVTVVYSICSVRSRAFRARFMEPKKLLQPAAAAVQRRRGKEKEKIIFHVWFFISSIRNKCETIVDCIVPRNWKAIFQDLLPWGDNLQRRRHHHLGYNLLLFIALHERERETEPGPKYGAWIALSKRTFLWPAS